MTRSVKLINSGFSLIDQKWGGIYKGGGYLIVGPRKSGRTLLSLKFAIETIQQSEKCLFFTTMRPKDLMIQAASLNFDLQKYMNSNSIIVVRVSTPNEVLDTYDPDSYMTEYINDIVTVANQYNPDRLIFDELTPYIGFKRLDVLEEVFTNMIETIENKNVTSFFVVGEPATEKSRTIVSILSDNVTGSICLEKSTNKTDEKSNTGNVILSPNVGHTEGQFTAEYLIEPKRGFIIAEEELSDSEKTNKSDVDFAKNIDSEKDSINTSGLVNIYDIDDFRLILNNQIAMYQSTGQRFNILSFKLDNIAQLKGMITIDQLKKVIAFSVKKRDKLCIINDKILILLIRSSDESLKKMLSKIRSTLTNYETEDIENTYKLISIADIEIDESIDNSDKLIDPIINDQNNIFYRPFNEYNL